MVRFASGREDVSGSRRRGGDDSKVAFENDLYAWICGQRAGNGAVISPPIVQQQALVVAKRYTNMNTFQASRGWYYRFCNRRLWPRCRRHHQPLTGNVTFFFVLFEYKVRTGPL
ncbi:hypothetical protein, variant [Aphanomyces astaci]|uniref:HTH CENPB-type domain-containing protein n=1 Tax=Aphanomyces astaci TaxID=112090 RepID=W4GG22_APHAT|nr:hypothetical protein, variant [Aphanomyces astaci]ETV77923.1 hypothetical protein, variant [Aphanomyces astaci]|eukprot:XP_009832260.1 hypothetical protein, variant [Aphanomyces astaci]